MQRKKAFTLAEVLITLGIIGIVAEITIPTLYTGFAKQSTVAKLQKEYTTLAQAVKLSEVDNGSVDSWAFPATDSSGSDPSLTLAFAQTYILPYLKIAKKCDLNTGMHCWPDSVKTLYGVPYGVSISDSSAYMAKYVLQDGSLLALKGNYVDATEGGGFVDVYVDINGLKGPNVVGKDIFSFFLVQKAALGCNRGNGDIAYYIKAGGLYPDGFAIDVATNYSYQYRGCGKDVTYGMGGSWCTAKIIQDGWQIKDNYPW